MNGAEGLIRAAIESGIEVCFANPGTTELPVVIASDSRWSEFRTVLCLHETVVTGAADGYGRMAGKPALTLLHLGPGLANGLANLHNARRAKTPLINLIGEHATWHLDADPPLASDIDALAGAVSAWQARSRDSDDPGKLLVQALAAAGTNGGQLASLVLAHDHLIGAATRPPDPVRFTRTWPSVPPDNISRAAEALRAGNAVLFMGNSALSETGLVAAGRIAEASGAQLMSQSSNARAERGGGLPAFAKLPYLPEQAIAALAPYRRIVLAGAKSPVRFLRLARIPKPICQPQS